MNERTHATRLKDIFAPDRQGPLFLRVNGYNAQVEAALVQLYGETLKSGVIFEGHIPAPTDANLSYYYETLGQEFQPDRGFIEAKLARWLPRTSPRQRADLAGAFAEMLDGMTRAGKTTGMLKNAYVRAMCWLYFKFERIAVCLGAQPLPRVIVQGDVNSSELQFLSALCAAGCDVVLILPGGDANYRKLDPDGALSDALPIAGESFPPNFSVGALYRSHQATPAPKPAAKPVAPRPAASKSNGPHIPTPPPELPLRLPKADYVFCTNAWMDSTRIDSFESIATPHRGRGTDSGQIYNCFIRMDGVEDALTYPNALIQLHQRLIGSGRKVFIQSGPFDQPTPDETASIRRGNYANMNAAIEHLATNLQSSARPSLQNTLVRAFMEVLGEEAKKPGMTVSRIVNSAVYMLCWYKRCASALFSEWKPGALGCLIALNVCDGQWAEREALFLRMMARTPADVLVLNPNLNANCALDDPMLFHQQFATSLVMHAYPQENGGMRVRTVASHAEAELDTLLYGSGGLYRNRQYELAQSVTLLTTYDEVLQYWNLDLKYRPSFDTVEGKVIVPVIFAQASGVKDGKTDAYWREIKKLVTPNCFTVYKLPFIQPNAVSPFSGAEFFRNGKLQREKLRAHKKYPFALLRPELQEHILDKLQALIDSKLIRGTFQNGMEYTIISTVLDMPAELVRLIQQFDFTKKNPKLLCVNAEQTAASRQDAILFAFLNLVGFDVMCYMPTGFQCFSQWYSSNPMQEHQLGEYVYDLNVPDFAQVSGSGFLGVINTIFKRGS